jgi:hypothetical protein
MESRREFIGIVAAVTLAACSGARAPSPSQRDAFMALSAALTGYNDLDPSIGAIYLQSLRALPDRAAALDALLQKTADVQRGAELNDPQLRSIAAEILRDWYTGTYEGSDGLTTATWTQAVAWRACSFTKPPSLCAAPGSWANRPA